VQDSDFATQLFTFIVAGAADDHYALCESWGNQQPCIITGFHGTGIKDGDKLMVQDAAACGLATESIPGLPHNSVLPARTPDIPRDFDIPGSPPGTHYRFETKNEGAETYRIAPLDVPKGLTARLCWCPLAANCLPSDPSQFRIDAGLITIIRFTWETEARCEIGKNCLITFELAPYNTPVVKSDLLMVKTGESTANRLASPGDRDICNGQRVKGLGPLGDGVSARMRVAFDTRPKAKITDRELGMFDLSTTAAEPGIYRLCWCQGSIRQCTDSSEFVIDVGQLTVSLPAYIWPDCSHKEQSFTGWRQWTNFDDCCCNFAEAGTVGCTNTTTRAS